MEALLLAIYSFFVWLIFIKFKWLPWNIKTQVTVAIIPIVGLTAQSMRSGPWTARFLPNVPVAIETRLEARPNFAGGGMVPEMFTTSLGQDQARQFAFERR